MEFAMIAHVLHTQGMNLWYANALVKDLTEEQMVAQPVAGKTMNHPAWVLGHLPTACDFALSLMGQKGVAPAGWDTLFGMSSKPQNDRKLYPSKAELLSALEAGYKAAGEAFKQFPAAKHADPMPDNLKQIWPTVGDALVFLLTAHDATHLGQLSAWRRAMGLPSVM
jgi:hypothetical protein